VDKFFFYIYFRNHKFICPDTINLYYTQQIEPFVLKLISLDFSESYDLISFLVRLFFFFLRKVYISNVC